MPPSSPWQEILVFLGYGQYCPEGSGLALLARGRGLADGLGSRVAALIMGDKLPGSAVSAAAEAGADEVISLEGPGLTHYHAEVFAQVLVSVVRERGAGLLLFPNTLEATEVAPAVAGMLGVPALTNCLDIELGDGALVVTRPMFGGTRHVRIQVARDTPLVATVQLRVRTAASEHRLANPAIRRVQLAAAQWSARTRVLGMSEPPAGDVDLTKAQVIVSAGRGAASKPTLKLIEDLASLLGGVVACSRPMADLDWLPRDRIVGTSGKTVRPKLYLACGISGASQHLAGMQESQTIIAINKDPYAPIFELAHYGVVGKLEEVLPALINSARLARAGA